MPWGPPTMSFMTDPQTTVSSEPAPTSAVLPPGGSVRPITRWGTPVMHHVQKPVTDFDADLRGLAADMVATMYAADGVGLAACQIGVDLALFVFDCPDDTGQMVQGVVCNPVLTLPEGKERRLDEDDEGCLSFPGVVHPLRPPRLRRGGRAGPRRCSGALCRRRPARPLPAARDRPLQRDGLRRPVAQAGPQEAAQAARLDRGALSRGLARRRRSPERRCSLSQLSRGRRASASRAGAARTSVPRVPAA